MNRQRLFLVSILFLGIGAAPALAQIPQISEATTPPRPEPGHDYVRQLNETVNPSNGQLSVRNPVPMPAGRQHSIPFFIAYDSGGAVYVMGVTGTIGSPWIVPGNATWLHSGGWSYTVPLETSMGGTYMDPDGYNYCQWSDDYVVYDASGGATSLTLATGQESRPGECSLLNFWINDPSNNGQIRSNGGTVYDADGTVYTFFPQIVWGLTYGPGTQFAASQIEDRNGNVIDISANPNGQFTYTDTLGRAILSSSGFGSGQTTLTPSGLGADTVTWSTASYNYNMNFQLTSQSTPGDCVSGSLNTSGSQAVISSIMLPNNQSYSFTYDPTYGRISSITYPTGVQVSYTWGMRPSPGIEILNGSGIDYYGNQYVCQYYYTEPVVTDRIVTLNGTQVLHQHFDYSNANQTYVAQTVRTDTNPATGATFVKVTYSYTQGSWDPNYNDPTWYGFPILNEAQEVYADGSGNTPRTVAKTWAGGDPRKLASQTTTLDNVSTSETTWGYDSNFQLTERDDYDYGSGGPGALLKKTVYNYNSFSPYHILNRPSSIKTYYSGGSSQSAETDYGYDASALTPASITVGRDPNYNGSTITTRGNATSMSKWDNTTGGSLTWNYTYDDTGQMVSALDPKSNSTGYSYSDDFTECGSPGGSTNAYLTKITDAKQFTELFAYRYCDGQLKSYTDKNSQPTSISFR